MSKFARLYFFLERIVVKSSQDNSSSLLEDSSIGMSKNISDFFLIIFWIAPNVFLLNGANNSKNSTTFSKGICGCSCLIINWIKQLFTFGIGLKHLAGTHFKYTTSQE